MLDSMHEATSSLRWKWLEVAISYRQTFWTPAAVATDSHGGVRELTYATLPAPLPSYFAQGTLLKVGMCFGL